MQDIKNAVEKNRQLILDAERYIWENPETGYKEYKTSKYMEDAFEKLGYDIVRAENLTGFYTTIDTGKPGPHILILGELDSIICPEHPEADPETGAVHSCGHNAQCAALLGIAAALKEKGIIDKFCGKIQLCAVPAEELLELSYRSELREKGIIKYFGGKPEFLSRGYFDGAQIAFMLHTSDGFLSKNGGVGCITKEIVYKGKAAHAGGAPWNGRNALYAATCGINAANALRETFKEQDIIRFHPIITKGGTMVNAIPETVHIETYVRGASFEAISKANKNIDRALCGAALSMGTNIEIIDVPGYAPLYNDKELLSLAHEAAKEAIPHREVPHRDEMASGSTDMGDLSCIMPAIHPYCGGAKGTVHGNNYYIVDPEAACVDSAKWQLGILSLLMRDGGKRAYEIIENFKGAFSSKDEYLRYIDSLYKNGDRITYKEDGAAVVKCH